MRTSKFSHCLAMWFLILGVFLLTSNSPAKAEQRNIKFAVDWVFHGGHSPYFVALDEGFYKQAGLTVTVDRGYGSADGIKRLAAKANDLVFADTGAAFLGRNAGTTAKMVAVIYEKAPNVIYTLKKNGISTPGDLEGKKIATNAGDANHTMFPALAKAAGIDQNKINWVTVAPSQKIPMLLSGKVDGATFYVLLDPIMDLKTAKLGGYNKIVYADHGVDIYSNGIATTDDFIAKNPDATRAFVRATIKAYAFSFAHPDKTTRIMVKRQSHLSAPIVKATIKTIRELVLTEAAMVDGIGYMKKTKMKRTRDTIFSAYDIKEPKVSLSEAYTNEFLR